MFGMVGVHPRIDERSAFGSMPGGAHPRSVWMWSGFTCRPASIWRCPRCSSPRDRARSGSTSRSLRRGQWPCASSWSRLRWPGAAQLPW